MTSSQPRTLTTAAVAEQRTPSIVTAWAHAWNGTDPEALGALFTADGSYTDHAIGVAFHGRQEIAGWKARADSLIDDIQVTVHAARLDGCRVTVEAVYAGHLKGAPKPFAVQMTTLLDLDDDHRLIASDEDHYSHIAVLTQSGLPADWTPPTP